SAEPAVLRLGRGRAVAVGPPDVPLMADLLVLRDLRARAAHTLAVAAICPERAGLEEAVHPPGVALEAHREELRRLLALTVLAGADPTLLLLARRVAVAVRPPHVAPLADGPGLRVHLAYRRRRGIAVVLTGAAAAVVSS